jgi:2-dehydropantoate 2-reductase
MLQDLDAGRQLEVDCLTGAVVELADRLDIPVPALRAVHACVSLLEERRARERARAVA